jgi:hypothetical protein
MELIASDNSALLVLSMQIVSPVQSYPGLLQPGPELKFLYCQRHDASCVDRQVMLGVI